jgi:anti-sigma factor RsiW
MNCREDLRTQSWLDGELQGAAAQVAERHMELCAECQAQAADTRHLCDALRRATRHYAPDALRARIDDVIDREIRRRHPRTFWVGAASGTGMTALAAALVIFVLLPPTAATLTASVIDAHDRALTSNQIIVVASSSHHTV